MLTCPHIKVQPRRYKLNSSANVRIDFASHLLRLEGDLLRCSGKIMRLLVLQQRNLLSFSISMKGLGGHFKFLTKCKEILLQKAKQAMWLVPSMLILIRDDTKLYIILSTDISFWIDIYKRSIEILPGWEDINTRRTRRTMKYDKCYRILMRGGSAKNDAYGTVYVKDVTDKLRKPVELCGKKDVLFSAVRKNAFPRVVSPSTNSNHIRPCYK